MARGLADDAIVRAMRRLTVPSNRLIHADGAPEYVVYQRLMRAGRAHVEDGPSFYEVRYRVSLYTKHGYTDLIKKVIAALAAEGFRAFSEDGEYYEEEWGYYMVPIECTYLEEV